MTALVCCPQWCDVDHDDPDLSGYEVEDGHRTHLYAVGGVDSRTSIINIELVEEEESPSIDLFGLDFRLSLDASQAKAVIDLLTHAVDKFDRTAGAA